MHKVLWAVLMLWLLGVGIVNVSCEKAEKSPGEAEQAAPKDAGSQASKTQTTDAISGKPVNRAVYADHEGKRIYFCCDNSRRSFRMDPEKYLNKFRELGVVLEDAPAGR